jgi:hypothetical protein
MSTPFPFPWFTGPSPYLVWFASYQVVSPPPIFSSLSPKLIKKSLHPLSRSFSLFISLYLSLSIPSPLCPHLCFFPLCSISSNQKFPRPTVFHGFPQEEIPTSV